MSKTAATSEMVSIVNEEGEEKRSDEQLKFYALEYFKGLEAERMRRKR